MTKSVNLYLSLGVFNDVGFWVVNFTDKDKILDSYDGKLLECYRKEIFGLEAAIEIRLAINTTLDILVWDSIKDGYIINKTQDGYSSEIPLNIVEDIFDLWAYNYNNIVLWRKYFGLLQFRKKLKKRNNYINTGLKGNTYDFAIKLEELLSYRPYNSSNELKTLNELMW